MSRVCAAVSRRDHRHGVFGIPPDRVVEMGERIEI